MHLNQVSPPLKKIEILIWTMDELLLFLKVCCTPEYGPIEEKGEKMKNKEPFAPFSPFYFLTIHLLFSPSSMQLFLKNLYIFHQSVVSLIFFCLVKRVTNSRYITHSHTSFDIKITNSGRWSFVFSFFILWPLKKKSLSLYIYKKKSINFSEKEKEKKNDRA